MISVTQVTDTRVAQLPARAANFVCSLKILSLLFLLIVLQWVMLNELVAANDVPYLPDSTITVGVRGDARPFSYVSTAQADEELLPGYSGYMVEICRRVLADMTTSGPFAGYRVDTRVVTTESRLADLDSGKIDMLCGPDSITLSRLYKYNTSHPLFLSGITYATVSDEMFPTTRYCDAVIGLVAGTTAETEGLRKLADSDALQLYDSALEEFLTLYANGDAVEPPVEILSRIAELRLNMTNGFSSANDRARGEDRIDPALVRTAVCPAGHRNGPVVFYDSHQEGIEDLCDGRILFYVADVDILSDRVGTCDVILQRETMTREAYGVFFRRSTQTMSGARGALRAAATQFPDSALYAEFNNVLIRKMQTTENILDYEFANEFKAEQPTDDLQQFFDGYKFVVDF